MLRLVLVPEIVVMDWNTPVDNTGSPVRQNT